MKQVLAFLLFLNGVLGFGQGVADSLAFQKEIDSLIVLAQKFRDERDLEKSMELSQAAEQKAANNFGKASAIYAAACANLGKANNSKRNFSEAEKWHREGLGIRGKIFGKFHEEYVSSLNDLAAMFAGKNEREKTIETYFEVLNIQEKTLGKANLEYALTLAKIGSNYFNLGKFEESEPYLLECMQIRQSLLKAGDIEIAKIQKILGLLYTNTGELQKAKKYLIECTTIIEKELGKEHLEYAFSANNLAGFYFRTGEYEQAEPLWQDCLKIYEKTHGKNHLQCAKIKTNLVGVNSEMGNSEKAIQLSIEARKIFESLPNYLKNQDYSVCVIGLGTTYYNASEFEKAEQVFEDCLVMLDTTFGKKHPNYTLCLANLAVVSKNLGKNQRAEQLYQEALNLTEAIFGKKHYGYASTLHNFAAFFRDTEQLPKADSLFQEVIQLRSEILGANSKGCLGSKWELAKLYEQQSRFSEADPIFETVISHDARQLSKGIFHLSERELLKYNASFEKKDHRLASFSHSRPSDKLGILPILNYENALFRKGFLLTAVEKIKKSARQNPQSAETSQQLGLLQEQLAQEISKPKNKQTGVSALEENIEKLEKVLARQLDKTDNTFSLVNWKEVQSSLKFGEVAIEFVQFPVVHPKTIDSIFYAALLLKKDAPAPVFIPLFEEKQLQKLLEKTRGLPSENINNLYFFTENGLSSLIFKPLEKELAGVKTIYFSPSGLLHRLNLGAIPISPSGVGGNETFADRFRLVQLKSTRQLVIPDEVKMAKNDAVLLGGIRFDYDSVAMKSSVSAADLGGTRGGLSFSQTDSLLRSGSWNFLPATEREVQNLEKTLGSAGISTAVKKGHEASEEFFKNIENAQTASPRILHIATHGYFFPDVRGEKRDVRPGADEPVFKISEHPMLRSGLILAGGNTAWQTGRPPKPDMEDGILTAYEISQMNLANTELVVLSACETGLGDIQGNEGVYGLQRAFKIAGAKFIIMSLWKVPDAQTSELMDVFYKKWLVEKMPIPEAFRAAQAAMRAKFADPFFWAGFVLVE